MRDFSPQLSAKALSKTVLTVGPAPADHMEDGTTDNVQFQQASETIPA